MTEAKLRDISAFVDHRKEILDGVREVRCFMDGAYTDSPKAGEGIDLKLELAGDKGTYFADVSAGIAYRISAAKYAVDYTIAHCRTKIAFGDKVLFASEEHDNPYDDEESGWDTYCYEWLLRHVFNDEFLKNCGITRLHSPKHAFSKEEPYGDLGVKTGCDLYFYGLKVEGENIEYPYYEIAVVKEADSPVNFALFVMKSRTDARAEMEGLIESFVRFSPKGAPKNYFFPGAPKENPRWSEETKKYFRMLSSSDRTHWGVFSYSMPGVENELHDGDPTYCKFLKNSQRMEETIEKAWGQPFDIYPTYTHIGKGKDSTDYVPHHFSLEMANVLAGGNGFNGKPVLQFTYQFTLNNNLVLEEETPMFDIMRGRYDEHFRRLARDIKKYGKPVLFRLNNEMNTDWTSYCGMMTLIDPEIFNETWIRLYKIFDAEGVDNCIWIWNPISTDIPYSSWGKDIAYFPGVDYVQLLGGTSYEMNNYEKEKAAASVRTFRTHYSNLYRKNAIFSQWSMVLSEFACGSGGDYTGELGRNLGVQAQWVRDMFCDLNAKEKPDWVKQIKGAIWFNCNDLIDSKVSNRLRFIDPDNDPDNITVEAFREGFRNAKK